MIISSPPVLACGEESNPSGYGDEKCIQIAWKGNATRSYPLAADILRPLVNDPELAELPMAFASVQIRNSSRPEDFSHG
ncbi:hypothetical protein [Roseibacillus persicicus]|uniref:hypothetical protein n=1 Tax=Roseibacillus persicicus TaxID=454148 RepID=UPI00280FAAB5|nr:hypothetical protein [Roseibacillus persicicus]MDQ8192164.1 hypothetical protein [Roseibacillus persicicus]